MSTLSWWEKKSNQSCWREEKGAPVPTPRAPSKEVCQPLEPGQEHLSFLLVVEAEPKDSRGFERQGHISL